MKTLRSVLPVLIFATVANANQGNACYTVGDYKFCVGDVVHCLDSSGRDTFGVIKEILSNGDLRIKDDLWVNASAVSPDVKCIGDICREACVYFNNKKKIKEQGIVDRLFKNGKAYIRREKYSSYASWCDITEVFTVVACDKHSGPDSH
jgi:hypothetical protein